MQLWMRKRLGISAELMEMLGLLFLVGIVWAVLYYGGILPTYQDIGGALGFSGYDPAVLAFVLAFSGFWMFIVTFRTILWLWQRSNKRGLEY